jgi:hypothetical protein
MFGSWYGEFSFVRHALAAGLLGGAMPILWRFADELDRQLRGADSGPADFQNQKTQSP